MRISCFAAQLLIVLGTATAATAQGTGLSVADSIELRNDCRLARQILVHGQPANKRPWALGIIPNCGIDGADALTHELRDTRGAQARTPELDALANAATDVIDGEIYRVAIEVAVDPSAGEAARVHALGVWHAQVTGGEILPYEALVSDPVTGAEIVLGPVTTVRPLTLRPLPTDALNSSISALMALIEGELNPRVLLAARHVLGSFEFRREEPGL